MLDGPNAKEHCSTHNSSSNKVNYPRTRLHRKIRVAKLIACRPNTQLGNVLIHQILSNHAVKTFVNQLWAKRTVSSTCSANIFSTNM